MTLKIQFQMQNFVPITSDTTMYKVTLKYYYNKKRRKKRSNTTS